MTSASQGGWQEGTSQEGKEVRESHGSRER